jgi:NAD(P)H dehydrogenase (quinone)
MVKIAIIQYSTYGHVTQLAKAIQQGVESAGGHADLFQVPETLNEEVLTLIHAPAKPADIPVASLETLQGYDAFLFGFPTRFGTIPAQFADFWGATGGLWASGALHGKPYGLFVSTGTPGGGQEVTFRNALSLFTHHGMIYVPLGYKNTFAELANLDEVHGSSPWGTGAYAAGDGSRQPSELEKKIATSQGAAFYNIVKKFGSEAAAPETSQEAVTEVKESAEETEIPVSKKTKAPARSSQVKQDTKAEGSKCCVIM